MKSTHRPSHRQHGYSLIEALTALLVTAFGMLAIAGFQVTLSRNADIAKQRSEAVRLAQLKMEELRSYEQVAADGAGGRFDYTDDVVGGSDTVTPTSGYSNATFSRTWTVSGTGGDLQKWIRVEVSWLDRTNTTQTVWLRSSIARADPLAIGTLATGPGGLKPRTPKGRNVDIPYPAVGLAGNMSAFAPPPSTRWFVFDNVSGEVLGDCTQEPGVGTSITWGQNGCTEGRGFLLSGYIRFVAGGYNQNQVDNTFGNPAGETKELSAGVEFIDPTTAATASCFAQRQKILAATNVADPITGTRLNISGATRNQGTSTVTVVTDQAHGFSIGQRIAINSVTAPTFNGVFRIESVPTSTSFTYRQVGPNESFSGGTPRSTASLVQQATLPEDEPTPPGYNSAPVSRFVAYACVVVPVNVNGTRRWSGQFVITPEITDGVSWALGTGSNTVKQVCRYTGNYLDDLRLSNSEHPLYYRGVTAALDNQNYVVIDGDQSCPYDSKPSYAGNPPDYMNSNTTLHQTASTGALPRGGLRSGTNSGGAARNGGIDSGFVEPADTSVELQML
jgi:Tfp pilus assembly protein PilV